MYHYSNFFCYFFLCILWSGEIQYGCRWIFSLCCWAFWRRQVCWGNGGEGPYVSSTLKGQCSAQCRLAPASWIFEWTFFKNSHCATQQTFEFVEDLYELGSPFNKHFFMISVLTEYFKTRQVRRYYLQCHREEFIKSLWVVVWFMAGLGSLSLNYKALQLTDWKDI